MPTVSVRWGCGGPAGGDSPASSGEALDPPGPMARATSCWMCWPVSVNAERFRQRLGAGRRPSEKLRRDPRDSTRAPRRQCRLVVGAGPIYRTAQSRANREKMTDAPSGVLPEFIPMARAHLHLPPGRVPGGRVRAAARGPRESARPRSPLAPIVKRMFLCCQLLDGPPSQRHLRLVIDLNERRCPRSRSGYQTGRGLRIRIRAGTEESPASDPYSSSRKARDHVAGALVAEQARAPGWRERVEEPGRAAPVFRSARWAVLGGTQRHDDA